jgi:trehalose 6-phosphate synthase/phosphatase
MKIVNISYRLPVSFHDTETGIIIKTSSGGLVSAVQSLKSNENELHWVGVANFSESDYEIGKESYSAEFVLHPVFIDDELNHGFYNGFSNAVLWPLFHYFPSFVEYKPKQFEAYLEANKIIADKVNQIISDDDIIWIHDYHLLPLACLIREVNPLAKIGFFLHIPFPSYELIRLLPKDCRDILIKSMLGADLIGFHTYDYAQHFLNTVQMIEGLQHKHFDLLYNNRTIRIGVFPISIEFEKFHDAFHLPEVITERENIKSSYQDMKIIFSVDRLDYTKGILYRLKGFEQFLIQYPEWKEKIVFLLVAVPSRDEVAKYIERKQMIELLISEINGKHGNTKWTPIVYQYDSVDFAELMGLYTCCDIALISPLRDGMNLVAKEFAASRSDQEGVLLLSDMTGAAKELSDAILFNPLDENEIAMKIDLALRMDKVEQKSRMVNLQSQIKKHNLLKWGNDFINGLEAVCGLKTNPDMLDSDINQTLISNYRNAKKRLILLDYDGTLSNFTPTPSEAKPSDRVVRLLQNLCAFPQNEVVIVSGRDNVTLDEWLGNLPIKLIAEHGTLAKDEVWKVMITDPILWKEGVLKIMNTFAENCSGAFVEEKSFSVCWHYRNANPESGFAQSREVISILNDYLISTNANIIDGNKVIEVKPVQINKGTAIVKLFNLSEYDFCLCIGDDKTDEDMFEMVNQFNGTTIKVGKASSIANYRLDTVSSVLAFLEQLNTKI